MKVVIVHNIISAYKTRLFNVLAKNLGADLRVIYLGETESQREWSIDTKIIAFAYEVLFRGRVDRVNPFKVVISLISRLNAHSPQVIIISGSNYNYLAYLGALIWSKIRRKKIVLVIESYRSVKELNFVMKFLKKFVIRRFDGVIVAGSRHKSYVVNLGIDPKRVFVMNGVGILDHLAWPQDLPKPRSEKEAICRKMNLPADNFLYVGRFSKEKNLIFLLEAFRRIKQQGNYPWGMILVGDGPQKKELVDFVNRTNIADVYFPGFRQAPELTIFYELGTVFILPSLVEPWGLVVEEAMLSGLPVLVSRNCGCYPDMINEGVNGFSFSPRDNQQLFDLMAEFINGKLDPRLMGEAARALIKGVGDNRCAQAWIEAIRVVEGIG